MTNVTVPEVILLDAFKKALAFVRADYAASAIVPTFVTTVNVSASIGIAQINHIVATNVQQGDQFKATLGSDTVAYTALDGDGAIEVYTALAALINVNVGMAAILTATVGSTLILTANDLDTPFTQTSTVVALRSTQDSYLYKLLGGAVIEKYNLFNQAAKVICGAVDDPRRFEIDLMFNMTRNGVPTAHITLPAETSDDRGNGIGMDENYIDPMWEDDENAEITEVESETEPADHWRPVFARRQQAVYNIIITSDNANEVVLLYHFIKALTIALVPHLHLSGLQNIRFGGRDIEPYAELQEQIYQRAVQLTLQYDQFVPSIHVKAMKTDAYGDGKPIIE